MTSRRSFFRTPTLGSSTSLVKVSQSHCLGLPWNLPLLINLHSQYFASRLVWSCCSRFRTEYVQAPSHPLHGDFSIHPPFFGPRTNSIPVTVTVTHTTCGHEEPTTTVTTDVPCTTELSTTPLTMESTTPVPAQVTTPVTGVSQSTVPTTSSIPVPVTSQISVSSTPEVSSQSTAPVSSQTPVPVTTTQTPVSSIPEVTTQRATEAMGLERSCRLPLEAFMPL